MNIITIGNYCLVRQYVERLNTGWKPVAYTDDKIFLIKGKRDIPNDIKGKLWDNEDIEREKKFGML